MLKKSIISISLLLVCSSLWLATKHLNVTEADKNQEVKITELEQQQAKLSNQVETERISEMNMAENKNYEQYVTLIKELLKIPTGYELSSVLEGKQQNGRNVLVFRYLPLGTPEILGGEHYSVTIEEESQKILGFTWMAEQFSIAKEPHLLSKEETERKVQSFLNQFEPGYFAQLSNLWIDRHDEEVIINNQKITVSGMKYKCFLPESNTYTWLIVGYNGDIITMEREIIWDGGRITERWLDDNYLKGAI